MEKIKKDLEVYLARKRKAFPRFFFISDPELLELLSNTGKPVLVAKHLKNIFENIFDLVFSESRVDDIEAVLSAEGETL